jgi:hypothetical protein
MASSSRWSSFGGGRRGGAGGGGQQRRSRYEDPYARFVADEARRAEEARAAHDAALRAAAAKAAFEVAQVQAVKDWEATGIIKCDCTGMVLPEYRAIAKRVIEEQSERERPQREAAWAEQARKRAEYEATVIAECKAEERK